MAVRGLADTTIRDFGGGWNVSDSDLNLNSRYQPVSDNVIRGIDGSFSVRQGMSLYADFKDGIENTVTGSRNYAAVADSPGISITVTAHGKATGNHVTISGVTVPVGGIPASEINGTHSILVVDANTIKIYARSAASATATVAIDTPIKFDTHMLGGNIIHDQYFNRQLLVFTDIGEIAMVDDDGTRVRIWGTKEADALSAGLVPTRRCDHWSSDTFKSTVIACNGYDKDKPVQISINDDTGAFTAEFLVDKATSSNAAVPCADYVVCLQGYVTFIRTEWGDPFIELSAKGTDGTFTRDASPADSAEVDLSMITSTVEPVLLGAAPIREKLYTAFYDKGMIGTLGVYNDAGAHQPDFSDTISENGTVSHRTMVSLGNDIFMCDYAGVPSVSISQQSGIYIPVRLSELISPAIQSHLSSLSEDTLRSKAFATFNRNDRSYMLFLPIYDEIARVLPQDPFVFNDDLKEYNWAIVRCPSHKLIENSHVTIANAPAIGDVSAANINGLRNVVSVIDADTFVVELGATPVSADISSGGGSGITITPVNDETLVYVFEYNKEFKIRRWTRYRGWNFDCACSSQRGKVFMGKGLRVYRMGDSDVPIHADFVGNYDYRSWVNNGTYGVGIRVKDTNDGLVYICALFHTSPATGTFAAYRAANPDVWSEYKGEPIVWALETPWSDMRERAKNKINVYVNLDSEGTDRFTVSAFVNKIRNKPTTNELIPVQSLEFQAGDSGGWGIQHPGNWGGGRRTREEKVWPFSLRGKLIRWRYSGATTQKVRIISHTMYYKLGNIR